MYRCYYENIHKNSYNGHQHNVVGLTQLYKKLCKLKAAQYKP
jgi:hypothetical protein